MSTRDLNRKSRLQERTWVACVGDFSVLRDFLAEKDTCIWVILQLLDALLRGYGQVVYANNPISGLLIVVTLTMTAPGTLLFSAATGFLGLLLSMLTHDSQNNIENGLTVYNPLLVGAVSCTLIPETYGGFDAFSYLVVLLGTIFSVYLTRSLASDKFPCISWPFTLSELTLLFALGAQNNFAEEKAVLDISDTDNATSDATASDALFIAENATHQYDNVYWGMIFRGIVVSPSQIYAMNDVIFGSAIYLAILIYSPITAGFCFAGALIGTLAGLQLGVSEEEVFSGVWGFNSFLTGASLGGNLFVLNGQTVAATLVAITYTVALQYTLLTLFDKINLPALMAPFVIATSLFLRLRKLGDDTFPRPTSVSFPEKQRYDYLAGRRCLSKENDEHESQVIVPMEKEVTEVLID